MRTMGLLGQHAAAFANLARRLTASEATRTAVKGCSLSPVKPPSSVLTDQAGKHQE